MKIRITGYKITPQHASIEVRTPNGLFNLPISLAKPITEEELCRLIGQGIRVVSNVMDNAQVVIDAVTNMTELEVPEE